MPRPLWDRKTTIKPKASLIKAPAKAAPVKVASTLTANFKTPATKGKAPATKVSPTPSAKFKTPKGGK